MSMTTTAICRLRQMVLRARRRRLKSIHPSKEEGAGSVFSVAQLLRSNRLQKPMIVAGRGGQTGRERVLHALDESDMTYALWEELPAFPTAEDGEKIRMQWIIDRCDCFIAIGDAAVIDVVKAAAARASGRSKPILNMAGRDKIKHRVAPVVAIPTVAGSGAEALSRAELSDAGGRRFLMEDAAILPPFAILDPELLADMSREAVTEAAIRGLCYAMEAYLSGFADEPTRAMAADAVRGFLEATEPCWNNGGTADHRCKLLSASRDAGEAASRAGFGYAEALSRNTAKATKGSFSEACAAILPVVMEKYGNQATSPLAALSERCGAAEDGMTKAEKAAALTDRIRQLFFCIGLSETLPIMGRDTVNEIAERSAAEANPWCACPEVWDASELAAVLRKAGAQETKIIR
ncbi:MAG: iron-containing alcohol dehydrogenase [Oscillospiraceae bacterium]